jgi:hypothetical protein
LQKGQVVDVKPRTCIVVLVVGAAAGILALPGLAAAPGRPVSGTLAGSAPGLSSFCTAGTFSVVATFDASFIGAGSLTGTITTSSCTRPPVCCPEPGVSAPFPLDVTLSFAGHGGSFIASGSGTGVLSAGFTQDFYEIDASLTIQAGTHRYQRAQGSFTLALTATANLHEAEETTQGTIVGLIAPGGHA